MIDWGETVLVQAQYRGPTPVAECLRWLDEHPEVERRSVLPHRDRLLAMLGRFDEAGRLLDAAAERVADVGSVRLKAGLAMRRFEGAMLAGDASRAEVAARALCDAAEDSSELGNFMWYSCNGSRALLALGRDEEAERWLELGYEKSPSEERVPQMLWRQARGLVLARRGELREGERLAREAVAFAGQMDMLNAHADALVDLAEVLTLAGKDAQPKLEQALALYERKGNLVMAERARARLAAA